MSACPFCEIAAGRAPAEMVHEWDHVIAFRPLKPVVEGHVLVVPRVHVEDFSTWPAVSASVMARAAELAANDPDRAYNIITSKGREATQSVFHLHLHLVPRAKDDGLALPWYSGRSNGHWQYGEQYRTFFKGEFDRVIWEPTEAEARKIVSIDTSERGQFRDREDGHGPNGRLVRRWVGDPEIVK